MAAGDGTVSYSPQTSLQGASPVNKCTALATITGERLHQEFVRDDFRPWPHQLHISCTPRTMPCIGCTNAGVAAVLLPRPSALGIRVSTRTADLTSSSPARGC